MASKTVTRSIDDILIYCRWYWWIYEPMAPEIAEEMNSFCRFCSIKQESVIFEHQSRKSLHGSYYYTWENRCFFSSLRFYFLSLAMGWCPWQPVTTSVTRVYGNCATLFSTKESFWCFYIAFKDIKYTLKLDSLLLTTILSFPCQYFERNGKQAWARKLTAGCLWFLPMIPTFRIYSLKNRTPFFLINTEFSHFCTYERHSDLFLSQNMLTNFCSLQI